MLPNQLFGTFLVSLKNRLEFAKSSSAGKDQRSHGKKKKHVEKKDPLMLWSIPTHLIVCACMTANRTDSTEFIDDVTCWQKQQDEICLFNKILQISLEGTLHSDTETDPRL